MSENLDPETQTIAESDNFMVWTAAEPDGETTYHLEMNTVTLHFFQEEWNDFLSTIKEAVDIEPDEEGTFPIEYDNVTIFLEAEEWNELQKMLAKL